jgi:hypothetical protein
MTASNSFNSSTRPINPTFIASQTDLEETIESDDAISDTKSIDNVDFAELLQQYEEKLGEVVSKSRYILYFLSAMIAKRIGMVVMRVILSKCFGVIQFSWN